MKTILMATLFALATLAPVAMAHNTNDGNVPYNQPIGNACGVEVEVSTSGADTSELPCIIPHTDTDRWGAGHVTGIGSGGKGSGTNAANSAGVAGRYVGGTGPLVEITGSEGTVFNVGAPVPDLLPVQLFAVITTLCDAEATTGPNVPNPNAGDEVLVDNAPGGSVPDGTWDDGGIAGACHVSTYDYTPYNDAGCPSGDYAVAEDAVLGESVEIGAGCDMTTTVSGGGPDPVGGASCAVNALIFDGHPVPDNVFAAVDCLASVLHCITTPADCANAPIIACGADGTTDVIAFGEGGGHATPTGNGEDGVQYPAAPTDSNGNTCANDGSQGGSPQVYTILGVRAEVPAGIISATDGPGVSISVPTVGWIDEVGSSTAQAPITICAPNVPGTAGHCIEHNANCDAEYVFVNGTKVFIWSIAHPGPC